MVMIMYAAVHVVFVRWTKMIFQPLSAQLSASTTTNVIGRVIRDSYAAKREPLLIARPIAKTYLSWPFMSFPLLGCISVTESLLWSLSGLMLLLTSSIGSVFTSSDRAGGEGVKLSLSVDDPKLPPPLPFVVKLIVSFKLLLLLLGTLLFVLSVLLLLPS